MEIITVNKEKLLDTLRTNRDAHHDLFVKAQEVFREKVIEALDKRLEAARNGGKIDLRIGLPEPLDYTDSFERAIAMVEWAEGNTVELSERDFQRYVLNDWEWAVAFAQNTGSYLVS